MKLAQSIAAHTILAVGGLTWAYLVWTDDGPDVNPSEVTIFECDPDALTNAELHTEDEDVTLEMREEEGSRTAWLTVTRRPEEGDPTTARFVGSDAVGDWIAQVAPLRARRSLGDLSESQLHEVGLDEPEGSLTLRCGGQRGTFQIGGRAYGNGDRYVRADGRGPVYLVSTDRLSPLESAELRLMERALHRFEATEIVSITLRAFDQEKRLLQHNRLDAQRAEWVDATAPDRRNDTYGNWLSRFPRLRVSSYLDPDAQPGADLEGMSAAAQPVMRMEYQGESGELGFLEMQRVDGAEQAYYVRTETTRSWVRVPSSVAQQVEDDLRSMLGVEPLAHPSPVSPATTTSAPSGAAPSGAAPAPSAPHDAPASGAQADSDSAHSDSAHADPAPPASERPAAANPAPAHPDSASPAPASPAPASPAPAP